jgi:hypothetical protein
MSRADSNLESMVRDTERKIHVLHEHYRSAVTDYLERWFAVQAERYMEQFPAHTRSFSLEQLNRLKAEVSSLTQQAGFLVSNYLWSVNCLGHPDRAIVQLRRACGFLDAVFKKFRYPIGLDIDSEYFLGDLEEPGELRNIRDEYYVQKRLLQELEQAMAAEASTGPVLQDTFSC